MIAIMFSTLKEAVRKKTFIVMGIITVIFLILWNIFLYFFMRDGNHHGEMFRDIASHLLTTVELQNASMLTTLMTIMLAAGAVSSDLETGVIHSIISRPLARGEYILGKYLGYAAISCAYSAALYTVVLSTAAIFGLPTVTGLNFGQIIGGLVFFMLGPLVLLCLTIFGSVSIRTVPNGILMIFIFILGYIGGTVEQVGNMINNRNVVGSGIFLSLVSPFQTLYSSATGILLPNTGLLGDMAGIVGGMVGSGSPASVWMYLYICVYAVGFLGLAVRQFSKKDIT